MTDKKLLIYSLLSCLLFLFSLSLVACSNQTANISPQQDIESFEYIVTKIDSEGLHGQSITDNTGIFLTHDTVNDNNVTLKENDKIKVSFPAHDPNFEIVTKITKIN